VFVVSDHTLIDLTNLVEGAVGKVEVIIADRQPAIGVVEGICM